jgi:hypothetical protein
MAISSNQGKTLADRMGEHQFTFSAGSTATAVLCQRQLIFFHFSKNSVIIPRSLQINQPPQDKFNTPIIFGVSFMALEILVLLAAIFNIGLFWQTLKRRLLS